MLTKCEKAPGSENRFEVTGIIDATTGAGTETLAYFSIPKRGDSYLSTDEYERASELKSTMRKLGLLENGTKSAREKAGAGLVTSNFSSLTVPVGQGYASGDRLTMVFEKTVEGPVKLAYIKPGRPTPAAPSASAYRA